MITPPYILGLDLGNTLVKLGKVGSPSIVFDDAIETIKLLMVYYFGKRVFIISKVTPEQRLRAEHFLKTSTFLTEIGLTCPHVLFCMERGDKAVLARHLGITHFIDDRPEVLAAMNDLPICRIAYDPIPEDLERFKTQLPDVKVVKNWLEIRRLFLL